MMLLGLFLLSISLEVTAQEDAGEEEADDEDVFHEEDDNDYNFCEPS